MFTFPISGVETFWWLPTVTALFVSCIASLAGLSGAFILLPFQVSVLGFTGPAVSATNLMFNVLAIPGGVYRLWREDRMVWPLVWLMIIGTLPGMFFGVLIRIKYLPDPTLFKLFAGLVLLYIGVRLVGNIVRKTPRKVSNNKRSFAINNAVFSLKEVRYDFDGETYRASGPGILVLSFIVGIVGGIYGIGGGAILVPYLVAFYRLPVHTLSGAALLGTFAASVAGTVFYYIFAPVYSGTGLAIAPDWLLGLALGVGGFVGIYIGARIQRFVPDRAIKIILALALLFISGRYIIGFFVS